MLLVVGPLLSTRIITTRQRVLPFYTVVTELVVLAYPKPETVFGGFLFYTLDKYPEVCKCVSDLAANNTDPKVNSMVGLIRIPPDMHHIIILMPLVLESADYAKKALAWAWELEPIQDYSRSMSYEQAAAAQGNSRGFPQYMNMS